MHKMLTAVMLGFSMVTAGCNSVMNSAGSGSFACPGMPNGVTCKSPSEVYAMTHNDNFGKKQTADQSYKRSKPVELYRNEVAPANAPAPIRTPALVMRTWIAPWKDKNDDLHWPGHVFTEIEGRKWEYGNENFASMNPIVPYRTKAQPTAAPQAQQPAEAGMPKPSENP